MSQGSIWKVVIFRAIFFLCAVVATVVVALVLVQRATAGNPGPAASGTFYQATVQGKASEGTGCRVTVDGSGAPATSNAPTRVTSTKACSALPAIGAKVELVSVDADTSVISGESASGEPLPVGAAIACGVIALPMWAGFIYWQRRLKELYREADAIEAQNASKSVGN